MLLYDRLILALVGFIGCINLIALGRIISLLEHIWRRIQ